MNIILLSNRNVFENLLSRKRIHSFWPPLLNLLFKSICFRIEDYIDLFCVVIDGFVEERV